MVLSNPVKKKDLTKLSTTPGAPQGNIFEQGMKSGKSFFEMHAASKGIDPRIAQMAHGNYAVLNQLAAMDSLKQKLAADDKAKKEAEAKEAYKKKREAGMAQGYGQLQMVKPQGGRDQLLAKSVLQGFMGGAPTGRRILTGA